MIITTPVVGPNQNTAYQALNQDYSGQGYWDGNVFTDWFLHRDSQAHNDMLSQMAFNASEAEKARQFEKMMSDTQFQRKVADYLKAGFSPLAALEGNGSYQVSSAPAASIANGSRGGANNLGAIFGALLMTVANFATKGIAGAASNAANASKAALDSQKLDILHDQVEVQKGWLDLAKNGKRGASAIAAEQALRKASHGHSSPNVDWDKLLDDLEKL